MVLVDLFLWLITYSFLGWAYESVLRSVLKKRLVNSGFLTGPICPIYGFGALSVILVLYQRVDNIALIFLFSMILTSAIEYITAVLLEKLFHAKWWDYSQLRFNFQGRVSLVGTIVFGALSVLLIKFVHPFVSGHIHAVSDRVQIWIAGIIFITLLFDVYMNVRSLVHLNVRLAEIQTAFNSFLEQYSKKSDELKTALFEKFEESEFYNERIKKLFRLNRLHGRRLALAYPKFTHLIYDDVWQRLKTILLDAAKKEK